MDVNGRIHIVGVLVVDKPVEGVKQVRCASCRCADGCPVNRVAAPPKRDARTSKVSEGASKLTRMATLPLVYALVFCPESSFMQWG